VRAACCVVFTRGIFGRLNLKEELEPLWRH
jgi:hypothetical protein